MSYHTRYYIMKKYLLLIVSLWISLSFVCAEGVSVDRALQVATNFSRQIPGSQLRSGQSLELAYAAKPTLRAASPEAYYYVFNRGDKNGYILVSAEDRAYPILGYSDSGDFCYDSIPDNMKWWLQQYADQIQYAYTNGVEPEKEVEEQWDALQSGTGLPQLRSSAVLQTALWGQHEPFNNQCPVINNKRAVTGCVATAMAIVMKYHQYPAQGTGSKTSNGNSANFATPYDWDQMLDDYTGSYSVDQGNAVATLMYHCGVSCDMKYNSSGSSAVMANMAPALSQYFGYDKGVRAVVKDGHSDAEWASYIQTELDEGRPVPYGGQSGSGGHSFVLAGYNTSNQYYVNWGWNETYGGAENNGWFSLSALTLDKYTYSYQQDMVIGIQKPAGGTPVYNIVIAKYDGSSKGLVSVPAQPQRGVSFTVKVSTLIGEGSGSYRAEAAVAHMDAEGKVKKIISPNHGLNVNTPGGHFSEITLSNCKITEPIETGDYLCLVANINGKGYEVVKGSPDLSTRIDLVNDPSVTYKVTWNTLSNVTLVPQSGYDANSIVGGEDFKFKLKNTGEETVLVKNGTTVLTPDADGVYTISEIWGDIQLTLSKVYEVTLPSSVPGFNIKVYSSGYDSQSVPEGSNFEFAVIPKSGYENYTVEVKVNGIVLQPASNGRYIIRNIKSDQNIEISTTAPDPDPVSYTVTLPEIEGATTDPKAGDHPVEAGEDFRFYITLDEEYNQSVPVVTTDRGDEILPAGSDNAYIVKSVDQPIVIKIDQIKKNTDVANEKIAAGKVKVTTSGEMLHIFTSEPLKARIVTFSGNIYKDLGTVTGDLRVKLPKGSYIVVVGEQSFKVIL